MRKYIPAAALFFFAISGCVSQPQTTEGLYECPIKNLGYAVSPQGECREFINFCSIPGDYNVVANCERAGKLAQSQKDANGLEENLNDADLCKGISCEDSCDSTTFKSGGKCLEGKCYYLSSKLNALQCGGTPLEVKYDFNAELQKCFYDNTIPKYSIAYKIRNLTDNIPALQSKIWLFVPALNYASGKTVQREYTKNKVMWEEQAVTFAGSTIRGQYWEIKTKSGDYNFMVIFCEPQYAKEELCNSETGIIVASGNTKELCPEFETIKQSEIKDFLIKELKIDS
ncbi:MAG TPA: hypothetical protein VJG83_05845 [archaeon]|nr:hypothetical protein [archaeon]